MKKINKIYFYNRTRFILFVCILFFILLLANCFINLYILKNAIRDLEVYTLQNGENSIEKWLEAKISAISAVKNLIDKQDYVTQKELIEKIIKQSVPISSFACIFVGYSDGSMLSSRTCTHLQKQDIISQQWYKQTLKNHKITIMEPYMSKLFDTLVSSICLPLSNSKGGVLCGILPLKDIQKQVLNIPLPYEGKAFITNQKDKILIHQSDDKITTTFDSQKRINTQYIYSKGKVKYTNWNLVIQLDKQKIYQKVNLQFKINLIIYIISLIIFIWLNLMYVNRQRESDEKLRMEKRTFQCFTEGDERGFLVTDSNNTVKYYNEQLLKLLHVKESDLDMMQLSNNSSLYQKLPLWLKERLNQMLQETMKKQMTHTDTFTFFYRKKQISLMFTFIPVKNNFSEDDRTILIIDNVTKKMLDQKLKKEQEDILFQQAKMADLGEMIGAISHQWHQPLNALSILLGNLLQFKQMGCLSDEVFKENLNHALYTTHYLAKTVDTFRNFYKANQELQIFDVGTAIRETNFIVEPYFKNTGIKIDIDFNKKSYECLNYKNEFQQIIESLLLNARDALLEQKNCANKYIKIRVREEEKEYFIEVEDNGPGVATSIKKTLFHPFKTTKGAKGTGNGLYLSLLIARKKLLGNLIVFSYKNPTIFVLNMAKYLKEK